MAHDATATAQLSGPPAAPAPGRRLALRSGAAVAWLETQILAFTLGANFVGAVLIFVFFTFLAPSNVDTPALSVDHTVAVICFLGYMALSLGFAYWRGVRSFLPVRKWLTDAPRPATPEERRAALTHPARLAMLSLAGWLGAALLFGGLNLSLDATGYLAVRSAVGILVAGLTSTGMVYLLLERLMRPVVARVLAGAEALRPASLGLRTRLLLTWTLGSGIPLLSVMTAPLGRNGIQEQGLAKPVMFLGASGIVVGLVFTVLLAKAVAGPLDEVRSTLRQVERGELDVALAVDDPGEIGALQAGVNRMVQGLRERERLSDLFGRHVGAAVAQEALRSEVRLGGEQRLVSALFVDLIGSTRLAATRPATEVVETLNLLFDTVVRVVGDEGGWVNKFEGDGALCVFGAPTDQVDHAARALRAARRLHVELVTAARDLPDLDAAIGVSSGMAVAGNVGALERYEYTVIGDPVNEASRLSELAKQRPGRTLASGGAVLGAAESDRDEAACWGQVDRIVLRGRSAPTIVMEPR